MVRPAHQADRHRLIGSMGGMRIKPLPNIHQKSIKDHQILRSTSDPSIVVYRSIFQIRSSSSIREQSCRLLWRDLTLSCTADDWRSPRHHVAADAMADRLRDRPGANQGRMDDDKRSWGTARPCVMASPGHAGIDDRASDRASSRGLVIRVVGIRHGHDPGCGMTRPRH